MRGPPGPNGSAQPHGPGQANNAQEPAEKGSILDRIIAKEQGQADAKTQSAALQMFPQNQTLQPQAAQVQQFNLMMQMQHMYSGAPSPCEMVFFYFFWHRVLLPSVNLIVILSLAFPGLCFTCRRCQTALSL